MEDKTANLLGVQIDQDRWKQVYWSVSNIKYGNELKWLVHQILRGCLTTNTVLKKMKKRNCAPFADKLQKPLLTFSGTAGRFHSFLVKLKIG